ncbi:MAG: radical SAM protein [Acidobacteriota bacterium]|nr:radical SAM protein [Acidobacteriota bacterium]
MNPEELAQPASVILKIAGRCNINCAYCYMYNLVDQTHLRQPRVMSQATLKATFDWIEEYLRHTGRKSFQIFLHGGEPLLAGRELIKFVASLRNQSEERTGGKIYLSILTNALLLDEQWIDLFAAERIRFGISLDGPAEYHDRFRLTKSGKPTHKQVEEKLKWVLSSPKARERFSSVLCVLHPDMDGAKLLRYFYELGLSGVDFLLPDQNHSHGSDCYPRPDATAKYGKVLVDAYRAWREIDDPDFYVRKFAMLIEAMFGEIPSLDSLGTGPITVFTVETSGEVEPVDSLKICGDGFTKTGVNINSASIEDVLSVPLIRLGLNKQKTLPADCLACRSRELCGGGYLPHRFKNGIFDKTVYCADMLHLCDVIRADVFSQIEFARSKANRQIAVL